MFACEVIFYDEDTKARDPFFFFLLANRQLATQYDKQVTFDVAGSSNRSL